VGPRVRKFDLSYRQRSIGSGGHPVKRSRTAPAVAEGESVDEHASVGDYGLPWSRIKGRPTREGSRSADLVHDREPQTSDSVALESVEKVGPSLPGEWDLATLYAINKPNRSDR
jgi:hypothetical protein